MWKQYGIYWIVIFILFGFVQDAGYVTDYLGWQLRVEDGGFSGALHTYDYPAQLQGYALLMWLTEYMRGISTWVVHAFSVTLYVSSACLLHVLVRNFFQDHNSTKAEFAGRLSAGLFLLSPTNTEILVWRVCPHYLVSILVWLSALLLLRRFIKDGSPKHLFVALIIQTVGLFSLELAYAFPIAVIGWSSYYLFFLKRGTWKRTLTVFGSSAILVGFHLLLTKLVQGAWIGHYGAEVATSQPFSEIIAAPWRWIARAGIHYRYWPNEWRFWLTATLGNPIISLGLYGLTALFLGGSVLKWISLRTSQESPPIWMSLSLWIFLAGAGTAAVSQLFFYDLLLVDTDRLGALTVLFTAVLVTTLVTLLQKRIGLILGLLLISTSAIFQAKTLGDWNNSQDILIGLSSSFSEVLAKAEKNGEAPETVYLLGYARTYNGIHLLGDNRIDHSALTGYLSSTVSGKDHLSNNEVELIDISQFHQFSSTDKLNAEWGNERLYISLDAHGAWMMYKDHGIVARRDNKFGFEVIVEEYNIQLVWDTPPPSNTIFLYQEFDRFKRLPYPVTDKSPQPTDQ